MIDIKKLTNKDIGKWVVYDNGYYENSGRIKSYNENNIFVVYRCDNKWHEFKKYTAQSTKANDLRFFKENE